jgi:hypothetical protein
MGTCSKCVKYDKKDMSIGYCEFRNRVIYGSDPACWRYEFQLPELIPETVKDDICEIKGCNNKAIIGWGPSKVRLCEKHFNTALGIVSDTVKQIKVLKK